MCISFFQIMESVKVIKIELSNPDLLPRQATPLSVGYDFKSPHDVTLQPFTPTKINLGFRLDMPSDIHCQLRLRSSTGSKGVILLADTIDADYHGEIVLNVMNLTGEPIAFGAQQRIGQLVFAARIPVQLTEGHVEPTARGSFGSTGF